MSVGQFFDFVKDLQYQVFKILEIKELCVPVFFENFQNPRASGSGSFTFSDSKEPLFLGF
jgi:hypothetical protein